MELTKKISFQTLYRSQDLHHEDADIRDLLMTNKIFSLHKQLQVKFELVLYSFRDYFKEHEFKCPCDEFERRTS